MLTSICRALSERLSSLEIPCYLADCVPEGASLPYITLDVRTPLSAHSTGLLTLVCWCAGDMPNAQRLHQMDLLLSLLPARGIRLDAGEGSLVLRPEGGAACIREAALHGVKTLWKMRYFPAA